MIFTSPTIEETFAALAEVLPPESLQLGVSLAGLTTYRVGGPVSIFIEPRDTTALIAAARIIRDTQIPMLVVGRGSNLLVAASGFHGVAIHLSGTFGEIVLPDSTDDVAVLRAGGAAALPALARRAARGGWSGMEFAVGIPGSVGGGVRMNAGGHGREIREVLITADVVDVAGGSAGGVVIDRRDVSELSLGYRKSNLAPTEVVVAAEFQVTRDLPDACNARIDEIVSWRREHQPGGSNAGSVFANPPGDSAGRLIDACGLKGFAIGGASVSERHANFFVAQPDASPDDVYSLVGEVRRLVHEATGVMLATELVLIGFDDLTDDRP